jgi:tetratricopeptide (TPR) repeat protein
MHPVFMQSLKFAVREVPAFVGHSFGEEDREIVDQIKSFLTKLGVRCDSGARPEPKGISQKILQRIRAADLFVGIFTRREKQPDGTYTTSPWTIDEKGAAIAEGKKLLLFVEEGVSEFGGLQGDYEYVPFSRDNFGAALIHAMDYVLAVTSVPFQCRVEAPNKIHLQFGGPSTPSQQLVELRKALAADPTNPSIRMGLAKALEQNQDRAGATRELKHLITDFPNIADGHHELAHLQERDEAYEAAVLNFQKALDLNPQDYKNFRCYGRCLYAWSRGIANATVRRPTLEKAKRLLERAAVIGGENARAQITGDIFVVEEALQEMDRGNDGKTRSAVA